MSIVSEEKIAEVRNRISIVSVLSRHVTLKKAGINFRGLCPFHSEKSPSFVVSEAKKIYHCFGCGKGGNVFTFLMEIGGLSFPEALRKCAQEVGVVIPEAPLTTFQKETRQTKEHFYKINKYALLFFKEELQKNKKALDFFKKRGLTIETLNKYHLGYAPAQRHPLLDFLKRKGILEKDAGALGLDRFRDRILFPLFDLNQRVLGFGGRGLDAEAVPKYLNSPESLIYKKGEALYGLSSAISAISKSGAIVVEGYFDCLAMHQVGFQNAVAPMGTALTAHQVEILKRFTDRFYIFFDHDAAGEQASERSLDIFLQAGIVPKVIQLAAEKDPDEFIQLHGKQSYELLIQKIKSAVSLLEFVMHRILVRCQDLPLQKTKVIEEMIPYLKQLPSDLEREEMIKKLSDQLQV
ncbi:MAG: DNA primase, partial [Deltaproteobacteria bacterium]|nr:DNA primase [Deltaproteobacteria bacterium]